MLEKEDAFIYLKILFQSAFKKIHIIESLPAFLLNSDAFKRKKIPKYRIGKKYILTLLNNSGIC